jgi:hypothetical protein
MNVRTQFNENNEPFAAAKTKKAQATPMINGKLIAQARH